MKILKLHCFAQFCVSLAYALLVYISPNRHFLLFLSLSQLTEYNNIHFLTKVFFPVFSSVHEVLFVILKVKIN